MINLTIGQTAAGNPFTLPADMVTQTFAILAKRRVGKSYSASVIAEEMVGANLPFVVLDPTGAWWGLRASADGKTEGLPVVIIGGGHGDLPLEPTAGRVIADLVVDHPGFYVIDLSQTESDAAQDRFATDFAVRLYRYKEKHRDPLHLFIDEADAFVPQRPFKGQERMLGAFEALVRRGGIRGIGVTLISQRPAVINKNVLTQTEAVLALQTTGPQDRIAIEDWIKSHVSDAERKEMVSSLASLQQGEAWFWSPGWLERFERVKIRERRTFNSSATPKVGERAIEPQRLAPVDLERLKDKIAATIEKVKADDPAILRQRIRELEWQLKEVPSKPEVQTVIKEIPVLDEAAVKQLTDLAQDVGVLAQLLASVAGQISADLGRISSQPQQPAPSPIPVKAATAAVKTPEAVTRLQDSEIKLKAGERRMLESLAQRYPGKVTRAQLATLSKFSVRGGTFNTYFGSLKRNGLLEEVGGELWITQAGLDYLGHNIPPEPQTTEELLEMWKGSLKLGERNMLETLVSVYPKWILRSDLAVRTGYEVTGGTFNTYLGNLRRNGLIEVEGQSVRASQTLFLGG